MIQEEICDTAIKKNNFPVEKSSQYRNLEYKISTVSNSTSEKAAYWDCHKIYTYIKTNKGINSCLIPKPHFLTSACHSFPLLITFYVRQVKVTPNTNIVT